MVAWWSGIAPTLVAAFLASTVEFVEALTVVLAVGAVRGWRGALGGTALGLLVLALLVVVLGPAITRIPETAVQLGLGLLLLLFGMRWLRKAILRAAGVIALHDETATFAAQSAALRSHGSAAGWDRVAVGTAFKITMVEELEVVFIVVAMGDGGHGLLLPAVVGAGLALVLVVLLGVALHRPIASLPENALKFIVGLLLSAFGTFWLGEGMGFAWPGADWSLPALVAGYLLAALALARVCRPRAALQAPVEPRVGA